MTDESTTDEHRLAAAAARKHHTEEVNLKQVRARTRADIREAIRAKRIDVKGLPTLEDFQVEALWQNADHQAERTTRMIRRPKRDGVQGALDFGSDYDQMIIVCRNRRTTLGLMTAQDRALMAAESAENRNQVDKADDDEQAAAAADIVILERFADYQSFDRHRKAAKK